jgi:WD40 repeat protein
MSKGKILILVLVSFVNSIAIMAIDISPGISVAAIAFSPSEDNYAMATNFDPLELENKVHWIGSVIQIADPVTRMPILIIEDFWMNARENILSLAYSPDGRTIASGSSFGRIHIFNVSDGQKLFELEKQGGAITSISFSPDGNVLATASADKKVKFWNVANGSLIRTINLTIIGTLHSISYSPDGNMLAVATGTGTLVGGIQVYNTGNGDFIFMPEDTENGRREWDDRGMYSAAFSNDGSMLAAGTARGTVILWEAKTGKFIREWSSGSLSDNKTINLGVLLGTSDVNGITAIAFSPNSKIIVSGSLNGIIDIRNIDGSKIGYAGNENEAVFSVSFNKDGNTVAVGTSEQSLLARIP